jgi:hypothetical protein
LRKNGGVFCRKLRENAMQAEKEKTMAKQESEVLKYDEYLLRGISGTESGRKKKKSASPH